MARWSDGISGLLGLVTRHSPSRIHLIYLLIAYRAPAVDVVQSIIFEQSAGLEAGYFGLFAKFGQPPGWRYGEWDFRPEWDYFSERNEDIEVKFDASQPAWQQGICNNTPNLASRNMQGGLPHFSSQAAHGRDTRQLICSDWALCVSRSVVCWSER